MKSNIINLASVWILILSFFLNSCSTNTYIQITGFAQGGTYRVVLDASKTDKSAQQLKSSIDSILKKVDFALSGYNKASLLSKFNRGEAFDSSSVEAKLFYDLCEYGKILAKETDGAVDVWAAPIFNLWGFGFTRDSLPSQNQIDEALQQSFKREMLNFNAVAQGYSCDLIADFLFANSVESMLIDVGGEIFTSGLNPHGKSWTIAVDAPIDGNNTPGENMQAVLSLPKGPYGVVTSGNYRKFYIKDGKKYAHTIDPRNGYPVQHNLLSATFISKVQSKEKCIGNAAVADAMATYCMVIGLEQAKSFILSNGNYEAFLIYNEDGKLKTWASPGLIEEITESELIRYTIR